MMTCFSDSKGRAQAAGVSTPHVDHNVAVLGGELPSLVADRFSVERDGRVARLTVFMSASKIGKGHCGALLVPVD